MENTRRSAHRHGIINTVSDLTDVDGAARRPDRRVGAGRVGDRPGAIKASTVARGGKAINLITTRPVPLGHPPVSSTTSEEEPRRGVLTPSVSP